MSIPSICKNILKVTDTEIEELEEVAQSQLNFLSPLRTATTARQYALGKHNLSVLKAFRELRDIIKCGESLIRKQGHDR